MFTPLKRNSHPCGFGRSFLEGLEGETALDHEMDPFSFFVSSYLI